MTKKDYILLANAIKEAGQSLSYASVNMPETKRTLDVVIATIAKELQKDNARFDFDKFGQACKN